METKTNLRDQIIANMTNHEFDFSDIDNLVVAALSNFPRVNINLSKGNKFIRKISNFGDTAIINIIVKPNIELIDYKQIICNHLNEEGLFAEPKSYRVIKVTLDKEID